ncbi:MAG TPA: hypothetical protein PLG56_10635 [Lacunisphaera sp.]|nr:hypothetical protein [Lacunisphaera sp.]
MKATNKAFWWRELKFFIEPHPVLHPEAGEIYVPRDHLKITFYADGPLKITGDSDSLDINFNDSDFLVLATEHRGVSHIYRILWRRLIGFELISASGTSEEVTKRFFLN